MLGFETPVTTGTLALLALALAIACLFEACNGFHDTANAVATVIYTRSLKPTVAVLWSGFCNFVGVIVSLWLGAGVAMGLVKLLPSEVLLGASMGQAIALILAMLLSATIWNLGTWYYGIPSSSSHAMIGSILGVGVAVSFLPGHVRFQGVNWGKALETLQALALSPIFGFGAAFGLLVLLRRLVRDQRLFHAPEGADQPPGWIRAVLVGTCTLVSGAHGFNDGQKGIGLVMIVLMSALPADYALNHSLSRDDTAKVVAAAVELESTLKEAAAAQPDGDKTIAVAVTELEKVRAGLEGKSVAEVPAAERAGLRRAVMKADSAIGALTKNELLKVTPEQAKKLKSGKGALLRASDYAPLWVMVLIAVCLGVGTTVGWRRIVVTVGEKIGKAHLTYGQGAAAETVAASTIALAGWLGMPVSTTHVLSSGIAGTMVAQSAGIQTETVRKIGAAWLLTLPATMLLSAVLFWLLRLVLPA